MNNETFKVGEIAILQNLTSWAGRYNGEEVEITGGLAPRFLRYMNGGFGFDTTYVVVFQGEEVAVRPSDLRKKRPPALEYETPRELEAA